MTAVQSGPELLMRRDASVDDLRKEAAAGRLYAILDACDAPAVPEKCSELGPERAVSLYRGTAEEMYWAIAPHLAVVDPETLEWIRSELWSQPWGIFAVADQNLEAMRRHFRRFLLVAAPNGEQWYFRFYDPRVLQRFLPTCSARQLNELFGPVAAFATSRVEGDAIDWVTNSDPRKTFRIYVPSRSEPEK
jgi:hypothetical protein